MYASKLPYSVDKISGVSCDRVRYVRADLIGDTSCTIWLYY